MHIDAQTGAASRPVEIWKYYQSISKLRATIVQNLTEQDSQAKGHLRRLDAWHWADVPEPSQNSAPSEFAVARVHWLT